MDIVTSSTCTAVGLLIRAGGVHGDPGRVDGGAERVELTLTGAELVLGRVPLLGEDLRVVLDLLQPGCRVRGVRSGVAAAGHAPE